MSLTWPTPSLLCTVALGHLELSPLEEPCTLCNGENGRAEVGLLPGLRALPLQHALSIRVLFLPSGITSGPFFQEAAAYLMALPLVGLWGVSPTPFSIYTGLVFGVSAAPGGGIVDGFTAPLIW